MRNRYFIVEYLKVSNFKSSSYFTDKLFFENEKNGIAKEEKKLC